MPSLLSLMVDSSRHQAAILANEQALTEICNRIVELTEQVDAARDALRLAEVEAALADAPDGWQPSLTPEAVNRLAAIDDEQRSEGRTFPHRFNFKE